MTPLGKNAILILLIAACLAGLLWSTGPRMIEWSLDTAVYPPGYSESKFRSVKLGMTESQVSELLGEPLNKWKTKSKPCLIRYYGPPGSKLANGLLHCPGSVPGSVIYFELDGKTVQWGDAAGQTAEQIEAALGKPFHEVLDRTATYWEYSRSSCDGHYTRRWIGFDDGGRVAEKKAYFWWD